MSSFPAVNPTYQDALALLQTMIFIVYILQIHVMEMSPYQKGNFAPRNTYDHIQFEQESEHYDFPVALHVSSQVVFNSSECICIGGSIH